MSFLKIPIKGISVFLLKNLDFFEKNIKTWWDIVSFEQYLSALIVPRQLRWYIPPNDDLLDNECNKEWSDFFTSNGLELCCYQASRGKISDWKENPRLH